MAKSVVVPEGFNAVVVFVAKDERTEGRTKIEIVDGDQWDVAEAIMALAEMQAITIEELEEENEALQDEDEPEGEEPEGEEPEEPAS